MAEEGRGAMRMRKHPAQQRAPKKWFQERVKKSTISRRDVEAQRFEINNFIILWRLRASASLREIPLFESEFFPTFLVPFPPRNREPS
jgi:hypothetical protein